jgi:ribosome-binding ATPase
MNPKSPSQENRVEDRDYRLNAVRKKHTTFGHQRTPAGPHGFRRHPRTGRPVPDDRLDWLTGLYEPKKTTYATIDCMDVPGFSFLDDHGRAAARRRFNDIRTVDMFVLVIRAFDNPSVPAYRETVNPARDLDELKTEMLLADLEMVTTRIDRLEKSVNKPTKTQARDKQELELQLKLQEAIENEKPISSVIE